ncbi:MAG TPA: hypothetical protein VFY90_12715 [Tepidiformaceae bacterium]|nr:hypothetical protein [Tepidiformaceae bacterium]
MAFLIIFFVGLLLTVLVFAVGEIFDLGDADADTGGEVGHGGPSPFSSRILFVFLTAFGGFGFLGDSAGWSVWLSITMALLGGAAVAGGTFFLVVMPMSRQQGSVHVTEDDYLDREGQVTSEIPEGGLGRVTFVVPASGARVSPAARSANGERIPNGTSVRIISVGTGIVTVVPIVTTTRIPTAEWPGRSTQ